MTLTVDELEQITKLLIKYIRWCGTKEISFSGDKAFYLKIYYEDRNIIFDEKLSERPPYAIGSLIDDMEGLKKVLSGEYMPCNLDLERLGAILTVLGETIEITD
jgi:hypothetical protein